jgi:hypothetical protein
VALVLALPRRWSVALADPARVAGLPTLRRYRDPTADRLGPTVSTDHTDWCARGHRCQRRLGEHRSQPWAIRTRYGAIVVTRVRQDRHDRLEVRAVVDLPAEPNRARRVATRVLVAVDRAVRRAAGITPSRPSR